jgi:predicted AAA+ superfamily ATPase
MIRRSAYLNSIKPFYNTPLVKVLTGLRRVGKSSLLHQIRQDLFDLGIPLASQLLINKELLEFDHIKTGKDLHSYIHTQLKNTSSQKVVMVDEIQDIEGWEEAINSLLAEGLADIYITGSNANIFSSELATKLTGRYVEFTVHPLGFTEFLEFRKNSAQPITSITEEFRLFKDYGGLPGVHYLPLTDEAALKYLADVQSAILLKDVVSRHKIRDVALLERIFSFVLTNIGKFTTAKSIADFLKSQRIVRAVDTVQDYLSYLCDAFLIRKLSRYDIVGKRRLEIIEKYYATDLGLRLARVGCLNEGFAGILENIVLNELLKRNYKVEVGQLGDLEIDFVVTKANQKVYFQVASSLSEESTIQREYGNLEKINDNYQKYIISPDPNLAHDRNGIIGLQLLDFLSGSEL